MIKALAIVLALAIIGMLTFAYLAHDRAQTIANLQLQLDAKAKTVETLTQAGKDNGTTITGLQRRLDVCAGQSQDVMLAAYQAAHAITITATERDQVATQAQQTRRSTYAKHDDAGAWAAGHLPPVLSDELQDRWQQTGRSDRDQADRRAAPAVRGAAGQSGGAPAHSPAT